MSQDSTVSKPKCEFSVAFKDCGKVATHYKRVVVNNTIKGQNHKFTPPDTYACDKHAKILKRGAHMHAPNIEVTIAKLPSPKVSCPAEQG